MPFVIEVLKRWIVVAAAVFCVTGLAYGLSQQVVRQAANDPQVQLAADAASALANGAAAASVVPADRVDLNRGLAPFLIVYDAAGKPIASSGVLDGATPDLPPGVLAHAKDQGENRVTWQPRPGVRIAAVVASHAGAAPGFVLAGRSLREVEAREDALLKLAVAGGLGSWLATLLAAVLAAWLARAATAAPSGTSRP